MTHPCHHMRFSLEAMEEMEAIRQGVFLKAREEVQMVVARQGVQIMPAGQEVQIMPARQKAIYYPERD